jgi:hypothetical protein
MQPVPKDMSKALEIEFGLCDDEFDVVDSDLPIAYNELRHREKIEGSKKVTQSWRMKERVCENSCQFHFQIYINVNNLHPSVIHHLLITQ